METTEATFYPARAAPARLRFDRGSLVTIAAYCVVIGFATPAITERATATAPISFPVARDKFC